MPKYLLIILVSMSVYASAKPTGATLYNRGTIWLGYPVPEDALVLKGVSKRGSFQQENIASFKEKEKNSGGKEVEFLLSVENLKLSASSENGLIRHVLGTFTWCFEDLTGPLYIRFCSPQAVLGTYNNFTGDYMLKNSGTKNWSLNLSPNYDATYS